MGAMTDIGQVRRIRAWMLFDWAQQPYATLGLTFIFAPYFAGVAAEQFTAQGVADPQARAQGLWSSAQTVAGLAIAFSAPFLGAWADATGRKLPWIYAFVAVTVICAASLWQLEPDGTGLMLVLVLFWLGFTTSEAAFNLNNALLPGLGPPSQIGRISGTATAIGYWGGVVALFVMLLFFAETDSGKTLIGLAPPLGLDPDAREGTRAVGPFIALWFAVFMIPYMLWMRGSDAPAQTRPRMGETLSSLGASIRGVLQRPSCAAFLAGSMFYRDGLGAVYSYGGIYATLVLGWSIVQIGVFGIIAAIAAAVVAWAGGLADQRFGPKPVIALCIWALIAVSCVIVGVSRDAILGIPLPAGSPLPDIVFYGCGVVMGGAGGVLYSASRTMMVRHADPDRPAEAFGLFALTGRATAFLAPMLITVATLWTGSPQLGFLPVIALFALGLILLRWVHPEGDQTP
jgi:UMF1 family MFS transporter